MYLNPAYPVNLNSGNGYRTSLAPWPTKPAMPLHRSANWRFKSLPGSRRPLRTTRGIAPRLSKIFTLVEQLVNADDSDDEEGDRLISHHR
ncbi:MAG: hypothetical protein WBA99_11415 [Nodosilinea sp.]